MESCSAEELVDTDTSLRNSTTPAVLLELIMALGCFTTSIRNSLCSPFSLHLTSTRHCHYESHTSLGFSSTFAVTHTSIIELDFFPSYAGMQSHSCSICCVRCDSTFLTHTYVHLCDRLLFSQSVHETIWSEFK